MQQRTVIQHVLKNCWRVCCNPSQTSVEFTTVTVRGLRCETTETSAVLDVLSASAFPEVDSG